MIYIILSLLISISLFYISYKVEKYKENEKLKNRDKKGRFIKRIRSIKVNDFLRDEYYEIGMV